MQKKEKKEKEIKRKKKSIHDRKPVFKLYIIYYSATCNLSSDICYCSIWHMYKIGKCRIRERLSSCRLPLLTGLLLFHYCVCCSPAYSRTLQGLSPSPHCANRVRSHSCSSRFLPGRRQSSTCTPTWGTAPFIPSTQNAKHVLCFKQVLLYWGLSRYLELCTCLSALLTMTCRKKGLNVK